MLGSNARWASQARVTACRSFLPPPPLPRNPDFVVWRAFPSLSYRCGGMDRGIEAQGSTEEHRKSAGTSSGGEEGRGLGGLIHVHSTPGGHAWGPVRKSGRVRRWIRSSRETRCWPLLAVGEAGGRKLSAPARFVLGGQCLGWPRPVRLSRRRLLLEPLRPGGCPRSTRGKGGLVASSGYMLSPDSPGRRSDRRHPWPLALGPWL